MRLVRTFLVNVAVMILLSAALLTIQWRLERSSERISELTTKVALLEQRQAAFIQYTRSLHKGETRKHGF